MKKASYGVVVACPLLAAAGSLRSAGSQPASSVAPRSLSYEFFKDKVEPVFLAKRAGHTRCVVCHTINNAPFHLVPLSPGAETWNDEQSRQNFELIQRVAAPACWRARCSSIRSPRRRVAIRITVATSNSARSRSRSG
jgi:hypothetical protein